VIFDLRALCTTRGRLGRLSTIVIAKRLNKEPHFIAEFARGDDKICTVYNSKQHQKASLLYRDASNNLKGLHFSGCCKNTTLFNSKMN